MEKLKKMAQEVFASTKSNEDVIQKILSVVTKVAYFVIFWGLFMLKVVFRIIGAVYGLFKRGVNVLDTAVKDTAERADAAAVIQAEKRTEA